MIINRDAGGKNRLSSNQWDPPLGGPVGSHAKVGNRTEGNAGFSQ